MDADIRAELKEIINRYNAAQENQEDRVNMHDLLIEVGSLDNEEVEKMIEILKSKVENGEQY